MEEKWTIDELEAMYLTKYDGDELTDSTGDEVQDFLQWCREKLCHLN